MSSVETEEVCEKCGFETLHITTYSWGEETFFCQTCGYSAKGFNGKMEEEHEGEGAYAIYNDKGMGMLGHIIDKKKFLKGFHETTMKDKTIATAYMTIKSEEGEWFAFDLINNRIKKITKDTSFSCNLFNPICNCMPKRR